MTVYQNSDYYSLFCVVYAKLCMSLIKLLSPSLLVRTGNMVTMLKKVWVGKNHKKSDNQTTWKKHSKVFIEVK